jgi:DNA polymerase-3 subunit epsilon
MAALFLHGDTMDFTFSKKTSGKADSTDITNASFVVLDTELTGLNAKKDSIVSIGAVRMTGPRIEIGQTFYRLVNPETALTQKSVVVHEITPSDVEKKPGIRQALLDLLDFIGNSMIVGHFISLDMSFINRDLRRYFSRSLGKRFIDTSSLYEWLRNEEKGFNRHFDENNENRDLFTIAKKYRIEVNGAHNSLVDAFVTAQVFQRFLGYLPKLGVNSMKDLLSVGKP